MAGGEAMARDGVLLLIPPIPLEPTLEAVCSPRR
jgi:hypothetical protein